MRSLRWLGLIAFTLFVVAAFTPLANLLNVRMAGVADVGPSDAEGAFAPLLVLSGSADETRSRMALAQGLGVPGSAILTAGQAHTTREEAEQLGELLLPLGRRRILLVADPIDMPRSRALMERAGFVVRPAPTAAGGPSNPEARLGLVRDIAIELTAWAYYRLRGIL